MFVKDDIAVILNETALAPDSPKGKADRGVVGMIVLAQDLLDVLSSFLSVIVWHGWEEVMGNVRVGDVMMEIVKNAKRAVYSQSSAALEVPDSLAVVGKSRIGVLEIGDEDQPEVDKQIGDQVELDNGDGAKDLTGVHENADHCGDTGSRLHHIPVLGLVKDSAVRVEMRGPTRVRLTGYID